MTRESRLARWLARKIVHPVLMSYLDIYADDEEPPADSGKPGYDPRSTVTGHYDIAANNDHDAPEVFAGRPPFGFTPGGPHERSRRDPAWKRSAGAPR